MSRRTDVGKHDVVFYRHDAELVDQVATYVAEALRADAGALVVATPEHRAAITQALERMGLPLAELAAQRRFVAVDAAEAMAKFLRAGRPDPELFAAAVGNLLDSVASDGAPVSAFGEMVALLWSAGNVIGAAEIEDGWNELARTRDFALLCGYPSASLERAALADVTRICGQHDDVRTTAPEAPPRAHRAVSVVLPPLRSSVPAARRFVAGALDSWDAAASVLHDAAAVVTELAANAVLHARSAFRVELLRDGPTVRVAVVDASHVAPQRRTPGPADPTGRGLATVDAIASRWGWDPKPDGKSVWAELAP